MSVLSALRSSKLITWKPTGKLQQTLGGSVERKGISLHSGKVSTVRLCPGFAGQGRWFEFRNSLVPASVEFAQVSPLCTTLCKDGVRIRTVEHLLSALEGFGVDNCRIQIENLDDQGDDAEIPIFDGSAREWVAALEEVGLEIATDADGKSCEKIAPHVNEPVHVWRNDSFVAAFPSEMVRVTYGINFPQASAIGCQWFSTTPFDDLVYSMQIALSRTFCIYEE
ncbi:UDP-3-O-[3-hydroxymyristoyl] N-acetylglucosamine deacetylase [Medicago truncatula]|nr:UDP-3-O-[3-hydroxymyristoyl] N-acetylglucosamine deacetylase [Medicago truncatula]